jgi:hypothetical protein
MEARSTNTDHGSLWAAPSSCVLVLALQKHVTRLKKMEKFTGGKMPFEAALQLVFDHALPFSLVSEVLLTAKEAGFGKFAHQHAWAWSRSVL